MGSVDGRPVRRSGTTWYRRDMSRIHAFGDDALGDLDAVGLVEKLRAGDVSPQEVVDAAIARTEAVNPTLNGLAYRAFDRARARASARGALRRLLRRCAFVHQGQRRRRGHADDGGHRRVGAQSGAARWRLRTVVPRDRLGAAGQDAVIRIRFQRFGRTRVSVRSAARGIPTTPQARRHRDRVRSSLRAWFRSRTQTTAAGPSEFPLPATD